jgi:hypothetical protein|tara:strand:+ start:333 stop:1250 length:918 start_codon:yes stop_codon:yes gene_type:complete
MALPYNNVKVSDLTEGQKEYVLPDNNDRENVMPMELRKFGRYLLQKMPMLKVTQRAANTKLWVYHPDETYMRGYIAYGDFRNDPQERLDTYWVYSRCISNNRYHGGDEYFMRSSKRLDKALQIARTNLSPWSIEEAAELTWDDMRSARRKEQSRLGDESLSLISPYLNNAYDTQIPKYKTVLDELDNLVQQMKHFNLPYKFVDSGLQKDLSNYFALTKKNNSILNRSDYTMSMVWIEERQAKTCEVKGEELWGYRGANAGAKTYPLDGIPEDLMGKMAVLQTVDVNTYIPDIGVRTSDEVFYVYR